MKAAVFTADRASALRELSSFVVPASRLEKPPAPTLPWGIAALDELTGGLPRGGLTEVCGPASSGRTSALIAALAEASRRGEYCALVDASDAFDALSAEQAGVQLSRVLWVRCGVRDSEHAARSQAPALRTSRPATRNSTGGRGGRHPRDVAGSAWKQFGSRPSVVNKGVHTEVSSISDFRFPISDLQPCAQAGPMRGVHAPVKAEIRTQKLEIERLEQALKATDLLLQGGGFGLVAIDLADLSVAAARRVPLTSWFRFRRAVENTPAALLVLEREPHARSCASLVLTLAADRIADEDAATPTHAHLLHGLNVRVAVQRTEKKSSQGVRTAYESSTAWSA